MAQQYPPAALLAQAIELVAGVPANSFTAADALSAATGSEDAGGLLQDDCCEVKELPPQPRRRRKIPSTSGRTPTATSSRPRSTTWPAGRLTALRGRSARPDPAAPLGGGRRGGCAGAAPVRQPELHQE
eukprot:731921-Prymnesium_polylepis.1